MNQLPSSLTSSPSMRAAARPIAPVLIRVPDLGSTHRPSSRFSRRPTIRRRRRLRREVRLAGVAILLLTPLTGAMLTFRKIEPEPVGVSAHLIGIEGLVPAPVQVDRRPGLTGAREPIGSHLTPYRRGTLSPVILPGYLLPNDEFEEGAHAGG